MDTQRLILLFIFGFSVLMLWEAWQKESRPKPPPVSQSAKQQEGVPSPQASVPQKPAAPEGRPAAPTEAAPAAKGEAIRVATDLMVVEIDTLGATLKRVELLKHKDSADPTKNFV